MVTKIQEERIRGFFLTAAKDLIRAEGVGVVTARNVAERAGYSYATLYNYFKDIRDLIFNCIEDLMKECREFVEKESEKKEAKSTPLLGLSKNYAKFFIQYPGIFELFYQQKMSAISTQQSNLRSLYEFFDTLTEREWERIRKGKSHKELLLIRENHKLAIHGLLSFYLNRRKEMEYNSLMKKIEDITTLAEQA